MLGSAVRIYTECCAQANNRNNPLCSKRRPSSADAASPRSSARPSAPPVQPSPVSSGRLPVRGSADFADFGAGDITVPAQWVALLETTGTPLTLGGRKTPPQSSRGVPLQNVVTRMLDTKLEALHGSQQEPSAAASMPIRPESRRNPESRSGRDNVVRPKVTRRYAPQNACLLQSVICSGRRTVRPRTPLTACDHEEERWLARSLCQV